MKYKITYTSEARRNLDEIWDYIAFELQNISAAERIVNSIMDEADQLADFAELGPALSSITNVKSDYRFLTTGDYLTLYRILDKEIQIERILNGRCNYLSHLFGPFRPENN